MMSVIIPVYKSELNLPSVVDALGQIFQSFDKMALGKLEVVFVVDGSPDGSFQLLQQLLPSAKFSSQLVLLSRNFGAFPAITAGLEAATGDQFCVMAADLQEPPELIIEFSKRLQSDFDIAFGTRIERDDPISSKLFSGLFWKFYRRFVNKDIPAGGVDIFACNKNVRDQVIALKERGSSLIGLLFWVGFKRGFVPYSRKKRELGKSSWSFSKKWNYFLDSFFSFTNLPIRLLTNLGAIGLILSILIGSIVTIAKLFGLISVPGYAATILTVLFFGGVNSLGLGIVGEYVWRTFQNSQGRPNFIVSYNSSYPEVNQAKQGNSL
jgi:glycosyltransferase involved in cell wall biosynthesis